MKKTNKGSINIVLVIILILVLGLAAYLYYVNSGSSSKSAVTSQSGDLTSSTTTATDNNGATAPTNTDTSGSVTTVTKTTSTSVAVNTKDWALYTNSGYHYQIKHPATVILGPALKDGSITFVSGGKTVLAISVDTTGATLDQKVADTVAIAKREATTPVTVTSKAFVIGGVSGYLITTQSNDAAQTTKAVFETFQRSKVTSFTYGYENATLTATPSSTDTALSAKLQAYNEVQAMIGSFVSLQ